MTPEQPEPGPVVFVHIPKTGGVAIGQFLASRLQGTYPWWTSVEEHRSGVPIGRLMGGHYHHATLAARAPPNAAWVTVLRDPVERVLSWWSHIQRNPELAPPGSNAASISLEDALAHPRLRSETSNAQTRYLGSGPRSESWRASTTDRLAVQDSALDIAIERLRSYAVVGVAERIHETEQLLAFVLGIAPTPPRLGVNVGKNRIRASDLRPRVVDTVLELNRLDAILSREAIRLFEDNHRAMVDTLLRERHSSSRPPTTKRAIDVDLSSLPASADWYDVIQRPDGRSQRWIAGDATVMVDIQRREPVLVSVEVGGAVSARAIAEAELVIDGSPLPTTRRGRNGLSVFQAVAPAIPERWWRRRTALTIHPGEVGRLPDDPRDLGLAVVGIRIGPT